jgi:hypothetical protein
MINKMTIAEYRKKKGLDKEKGTQAGEKAWQEFEIDVLYMLLQYRSLSAIERKLRRLATANLHGPSAEVRNSKIRKINYIKD